MNNRIVRHVFPTYSRRYASYVFKNPKTFSEKSLHWIDRPTMPQKTVCPKIIKFQIPHDNVRIGTCYILCILGSIMYVVPGPENAHTDGEKKHYQKLTRLGMYPSSS